MTSLKKENEMPTPTASGGSDVTITMPSNRWNHVATACMMAEAIVKDADSAQELKFARQSIVECTLHQSFEGALKGVGTK